MSGILILAIVLLNVFFSFINARYSGKTWNETKGWSRVVNWASLIMSASGLTWVLSLGLGFVVYLSGYLDMIHLKKLFDMSYLAVIFPIVGSGAIITIESWKQFLKEKSTINGLNTAWNTYAMGSNVYSIYKNADVASNSAKDIFGELWDGDLEDGFAKVVVIVGLFAIFGGVLSTYLVFNYYRKRS